MAETTTYRVETVYEISDKASKSLGEIEKSARKTAESTKSLKEMLFAVGEIAVVEKSWEALKEAIFGGNRALEQHRTVLTGITAMTTGASLERSWERSAVSMERFEEMSWKSGSAVSEIVKAATLMNGPLLQAGLKMTQIEEMSHNVAKAAGAFGLSSEAVSESITRAIVTGHGANKDMFLRSILSQSGMHVDFGKFQTEMTAQDRAKLIQKALTGSNLQSFIDKQGGTFGGAVGNIKSHLEKLTSSAGKPLFEAATQELVKIQSWIEHNRPRLEEMGRTFSQHMLSAFSFLKDLGQSLLPLIRESLTVVKDVMSFASEHRDVLFTLAKGLLVYKGVSLAGNAVKGGYGDAKGLLSGIFGAEGIGGLKEVFSSFKSVGSDGAGLASAFGSLLTKMPGVIGGFAKIAGLAYAVGGILFKDTEHDKAQRKRAEEVMKTADTFRGQKETVRELESRLKSFAPGEDVYKTKFASPSLQRWQDQLKDSAGALREAEFAIMEKAKKEGFITESVEGGRRKVSLGAGPSIEYSKAWQANIDSNTVMKQQLVEIFKDKAVSAQSEVPYLMRGMEQYGYFSPTKMVGFFTEAIHEAKKADIDEGLQAKPPIQNININIQQVSAKDPNRWLAEMDDMVARRTRANTRAKRALKSSPQ